MIREKHKERHEHQAQWTVVVFFFLSFSSGFSRILSRTLFSLRLNRCRSHNAVRPEIVCQLSRYQRWSDVRADVLSSFCRMPVLGSPSLTMSAVNRQRDQHYPSCAVMSERVRRKTPHKLRGQDETRTDRTEFDGDGRMAEVGTEFPMLCSAPHGPRPTLSLITPECCDVGASRFAIARSCRTPALAILLSLFSCGNSEPASHRRANAVSASADVAKHVHVSLFWKRVST